jgi:membrane-bound lytic murein transglycosylase B
MYLPAQGDEAHPKAAALLSKLKKQLRVPAGYLAEVLASESTFDRLSGRSDSPVE